MLYTDADAVAKHQVSQPVAVDQHNPAHELGAELRGPGREMGGRHEHAFAGPSSLQTSRKIANIANGNRRTRLQALGLDANRIEAKLIQRDNSVDAAVPRTPKAPRHLGAIAAIPHGQQHIDHHALKKLW